MGARRPPMSYNYHPKAALSASLVDQPNQPTNALPGRAQVRYLRIEVPGQCGPGNSEDRKARDHAKLASRRVSRRAFIKRTRVIAAPLCPGYAQWRQTSWTPLSIYRPATESCEGRDTTACFSIRQRQNKPHQNVESGPHLAMALVTRYKPAN